MEMKPSKNNFVFEMEIASNRLEEITKREREHRLLLGNYRYSSGL